ncbi:hypothetical protein ACWEOW_16575 [Monashia sp. NPDC004114]
MVDQDVVSDVLEPDITVGRLVEQRERGGQVSTLVRGECLVVDRLRNLEILVEAGKEVLGTPRIAFSRLALSKCELYVRPVVECPGLPESVTLKVQACDRLAN